MALNKDIQLDNGVTVSYHRVVRVACYTNVQNTIEVASYTSASQRAREKEAMLATTDVTGAAVATLADPYIVTSLFETSYQQGMSIVDAYDYLKTLPAFEGATDVMEVGQGAAE